MDQPADTPVAKVVVCPGCERDVPNGAIYCPYCCGKDGRSGALKRGAFIGGVCGLMVGGVLAAIWSSVVGPERATWGVTFGVAVAGMATGMIWGMLRQRRQP